MCKLETCTHGFKTCTHGFNTRTYRFNTRTHSEPASRHAIEDRQGGQSVGLQPHARGGHGIARIVVGRP